TAMDASKAAEHVTQTQDDRMKALAAATAISKAMQAVDEIKKLGEAMTQANQNAGIRLSLTVGSSQSKSTQHNESDQAVSSAISAGKNLSLIASGGGADSNVTVRGSALTGQDVLIKADNAINLLAAGNSSEQHSKDSSTSASVGIGVTLGKQNSLGFTASASVSKGNSDGTDNYFTTTQVTGGSSVKLVSGGDTTLQGAVVSGPKVGVDVGGNLKIESLQDTAKFDSKSMSAGGSVTIGYGSSASANFSQSKVSADFAAVGEQAGIRAGDSGFQVNVKGKTDLKGGAITSSQAAIESVQGERRDGERGDWRRHGRRVQGQRRRPQHHAQHDQRGQHDDHQRGCIKSGGARQAGSRGDQRRDGGQAGAGLERAGTGATGEAQRADRGGVWCAGVEGGGHVCRQAGHRAARRSEGSDGSWRRSRG
ncbi:MAG: hypothetical protein EON60_12030, partial [Alphaproteobacteria bacterium]